MPHRQAHKLNHAEPRSQCMIDVPRGVFVQAVMSSCGIATTQKVSSIRRLASQFTVQRRKPYSVRYEAVNAMSLNEFLKEHRKNEEQQATIAQLKKDLQANAAQHQKQFDALSAALQKVSAQLETRKPAPQVVINP
jgi:hypothetical protein